MLIDPPRQAWYRRGEKPPAGSAVADSLRQRDAATARALRAYLDSRPDPTGPVARESRVRTAL